MFTKLLTRVSQDLGRYLLQSSLRLSIFRERLGASRVRSLRSPLPDSLFAPLTRPAHSHQKEQLPERPEVTPLGTKMVPRGALYLASDNQLMAVPIRVGINPNPGPPVRLFQIEGAGPRASFAVAADGQRFLVINRKLEGRISILTNWEATLRP